ncbi:MAG: VWA domain-containing protein, partial [Desulfobacterales bacterium]|nr:VWA domain-containing protein [Desulfobacterales bacterium]
DFNADRRVNIKCPSAIDKDRVGQFELDGFKQTIRRLYHELDGNLAQSAKENKVGYTFSGNPNKGSFFVCHAKAAFPAGRLKSLAPQDKIAFQEVFFVTDVDWGNHAVQLVRQRGRKKFTLGVNDFEKGFIWYNALLDKEKAYIPVYGFLSLPGEASEFPTIWNSWEADRQDMATPMESLIDYDFYKILDYREGYYLLGRDFNELDYRGNVEDYGIIGWVEKKFITLWRSRLYYSPQQRVSFYNDARTEIVAPESNEINRFYVDHAYQQERLFREIVDKLDQESLHQFYTHFGFPQLGSPEYFNKDLSRTRVFIPGAFTPRLMRLLARSMKKNLNTFFLLDVSYSMRPFADYVKSFNTAVRDMQHEGIGLRVNRTFAYWDSAESDEDLLADPNFIRVKRPEQIKFPRESRDLNYTEPLMRALIKVLNEIETLQAEKTILPLHQKLLFIITDAGPNDLSEKVLAETFQKAKALNLSIYFVYPKESGIRHASPNLVDTPADAYNDLKALITRYTAGSGDGQAINVRQFQFKRKVLKSKQARKKYFVEQQRQLLGGIKDYINHVFSGHPDTEISKDVVLFFSDNNLLTEMRKWSDRKIQVLNHVAKYIEDFKDPAIWEERIAIPAKPIESYLRAVRTQDDVSLSDLKKLVIINSLVSVDDIATCRRLYDHIKPLIERKMFKSADAVFYEALTNKEPGKDIQWNSALGESRGPLTDYLSERGFHLNSFNQAIQRKFMYLKVEDLYITADSPKQ